MSPEVIHSSPLATVVLGDALHYLPTLTAGSVDLLVTDPPYGVEWRSNYRAESFDPLVNDGAKDRPGVHQVMAASVRALRPFRHLYAFGPADPLAGLPLGTPVDLIWDKCMTGTGNLASPWGAQHEPITFAVHIPSPSQRAVGRGNGTARMRKGSIIRARRPNSRGVRHPSEKPVALLRELIESSSRQGDLVLDPFAGIGSTGVAAVLSGRRALLVEIDPDWARVAVERVRRAEEIAALAGVA